MRDLVDVFRDSDRKSRRPHRDEELAEPEDNEPDIDEADGWDGYYEMPESPMRRCGNDIQRSA